MEVKTEAMETESEAMETDAVETSAVETKGDTTNDRRTCFVLFHKFVKEVIESLLWLSSLFMLCGFAHSDSCAHEAV